MVMGHANACTYYSGIGEGDEAVVYAGDMGFGLTRCLRVSLPLDACPSVCVCVCICVRVRVRVRVR
eukprot:1768919-Rhodomonas_salina.3